MAISIRADEIDKMLPASLDTRFNKTTKGFQNEQLLEQLRNREKAMLKQKFGVDTISELRENLKKAKEAAPQLQQLNGKIMRRMVGEFGRLIGNKNDIENYEFRQLLNEELERIVSEEGKNIADISLEQVILNLVKQTYDEEVSVGKGGKVNSLTFWRNLREKDIQDAFLNNLAPVTQARIRLFMNRRKKTSLGISSSVRTGNGSLEVEVPLNWYDYSKGYTTKNLPYSAEEIKEINEQFKQKFIQEFGSGIPRLSEILDYVFSKDDKILFVGNSTNQIVGICGEVQALCYLSLLIKNFSLGSDPKGVDWIAKALTAGKQSHDDIALGNYGIQVKNTTKELFSNIEFDFVDSTLDVFLNNLVYQNIIDYELKQYIMNVYEAYQFNPEYIMSYSGSKKNKDRFGQATASSNKNFEHIREKIERLYDGLEIVLERLTGILMYIGIGNANKNRPSNILFFVSGEIFAASEIIERVLDEIEQEYHSFNVSIKYNSSYSIINYINDNGPKVFNHPNNVVFIDELLSRNIRITSSYNFGSLFNII